MNSNTTLAIFAIVAAFGLMATLLVVEPTMQQAFAQSTNRLKACANPQAGTRVQFCR